jgi:hypothetical protein
VLFDRFMTFIGKKYDLSKKKLSAELLNFQTFKILLKNFKIFAKKGQKSS